MSDADKDHQVRCARCRKMLPCPELDAVRVAVNAQLLREENESLRRQVVALHEALAARRG